MTSIRSIALAGTMLIAGMVSLADIAIAKPGGNGWQNAQQFAVPTGQTDLFLHIGCPTGYSVQNGGIIPLSAQTVNNGFLLTGNGPRLDETPPGYAEWAWKIEWNNGGAPAGSILAINVLCKKGAA
jgi:hypothetical protein